MTKSLALLATSLLAAPFTGLGLENADIPTDAPADAVMASPQEIQAMQEWTAGVFRDNQPIKDQSQVRVELRRQDHSVLRFGQSCIETPLQIGRREFAHGLGTHANSEIVLHLPPGAKVFKAFAGIDNNSDTQGKHGTAQFSVEAGGKELFRTPTLRGGEEPVAVEVNLPAGTRQLILKVDATPDGTSHDQADWAEAGVVLENGKTVPADAGQQTFLGQSLPFSFMYGGVSSTGLLATWTCSVTSTQQMNRAVRMIRWADPKTGLQVTADVTTFNRYPATEWVLHFENTGAQDTPIIENIQTLDAQLRTGYQRKPVVLHQITGDVCGEQSFLPKETALEPGKPVTFAPVGGRPSNHTFPFFNVQYGDEGLITAIGWSGQWAARLERNGTGPTRLQAGMEKTRLKLHPGERIRSPRILVMAWKGDRVDAHARFRRLLMFEYVPKQNGRPLQMPVASQCFDRYVNTVPSWATEAGQISAARFTRDLGCDTHWFDAAWFVGGFPDGVGNWFCKPREFPRGLKPVGDACRDLGIKFLVWFEPERVAAKSEIAREHPDFVHGGTNGGLFKLDDPAARRWMADLLSARIEEFGLGCYRNDFNMDPLDFWRRNDAPDRQGMTEIRYVEGHYLLWDELLARHPGLYIDNCCSGGRRIDLETISRSVPLWRSDTGCAPGHSDWDQVQALGLGQYVPLSASCAWEPRPYVLRSAGTAGAIFQFDFLNPKFPADQARTAVGEIKANQKFWYGDFYPLTRAATGDDGWAAWQLHRGDLNAGMVLGFRRNQCPYPVLQTRLRGIKPATQYAVEVIDEEWKKQTRIMNGAELAGDFELRIPGKGSSVLVRYTAKR